MNMNPRLLAMMQQQRMMGGTAPGGPQAMPMPMPGMGGGGAMPGMMAPPSPGVNPAPPMGGMAPKPGGVAQGSPMPPQAQPMPMGGGAASGMNPMMMAMMMQRMRGQMPGQTSQGTQSGGASDLQAGGVVNPGGAPTTGPDQAAAGATPTPQSGPFGLLSGALGGMPPWMIPGLFGGSSY